MFSAIGDLLPKIPDEDPWYRTATLADALARIPREKDEVGEPTLWTIAFDQFEEMFSNYPQRWRDRAEFFIQVTKALQQDNMLRVLFVLREDYLAGFMEFAGLLPEGARTRYHLERLRQPEALLVVTLPLEGKRWSFAPGVAKTLVSDLMAVTVESPLGEMVSVPGEFVEPVQLQVVGTAYLSAFRRRAKKSRWKICGTSATRIKPCNRSTRKRLNLPWPNRALMKESCAHGSTRT
jgi:hypothetical protein